MFLTMDLGKTLNWIILSSVVTLVYDWTAKSDSIASVPSSHNYVTQTGKISRWLNSISRLDLQAATICRLLLRFLLLLVVKNCLQEID